MDARRFVCYASNSQDKVMGVREFQIGEALRANQLQLLSQRVPSQWGAKNLFDLCLFFGHVDTAMAMAQRVEGCRVEADHLIRIRNEDVGSPVPSDVCENEPLKTFVECCFGFPAEEGIWMGDWDANLQDASESACEAAEQLLVRAILEALGSGAILPVTISGEAMAHLLDLAILTGNKEAARRCAELSNFAPLRRWSIRDIFDMNFTYVDVLLSEGNKLRLYPAAFFGNYDLVLAQLLAALSVGAEFQSLGLLDETGGVENGVTLFEALMFSEASLADFAALLPFRPKMERNGPGRFFVEVVSGRLRKDCLQKAQMAGMSLQTWLVPGRLYEELGVHDVSLSLLDVAILAGQDDCAVLCAAMNTKLSKDGCNLLRRHSDANPASRPAARAAANQMLAMSWKSEISAKGIAVYQVMMKFSSVKCCPSQWVNKLVALGIDVPEIVDQLDLWKEAHEWCESV